MFRAILPRVSLGHAIGSRVTPIFIESHCRAEKTKTGKIHEARYETIIPHLAWLGSLKKKIPIIQYPLYSQCIQPEGMNSIGRWPSNPNDKRPNILDEDPRACFFRVFLFFPSSLSICFILLYPFFSYFFSGGGEGERMRGQFSSDVRG